MTKEERQAEAERLFHEASLVDGGGDDDQALALDRRAALLGQVDAQSNLGVTLTIRGGVHRAEGVRWLKRSAYAGNGLAAWNLAMEHRIGGARAAYLRWMRVSARLGHDDAVLVVAEIERRRAAGEPWFMLKAGYVDAIDVEWILDDVRDGALSGAQAADWAEGVIRRRDALGPVPSDSARLLPVLWEMTRANLTPLRATELIFKLTA